jgi:hypothetical protein
MDDHHGPVLIVTHFPEEIPPSDRCRYFTLAPSQEGTAQVQLFPHSLLSLTNAANSHKLGGK